MRIKHLSYCLLTFFFFSSSATLAQTPERQTPPPIAFSQDTLVIKTSGAARNFTIEVAASPAQQERGLMFRKTLKHDHGMIFIMPKDNQISMWMKNTLIPLDMVFIDSHGVIVRIAENTTPESTAIIPSGQPVRAVLELAGGTAALFGIKAGDHVISHYFKP